MAGILKMPWTGEDTLSALARLIALTASREPLTALLDELLRFAERLTPDMRCSILLADLSSGVLRSGAAPSLPPAYTAAIDRLPIADGVGSCGTAAARRETVIVSDIAQSPLWCNYTKLAREHGLGACWSVPLMDSRGVLLGTCAMYYAQPRAPTAAERDSIRITGHLAAMVIQRHRDADGLRASEARHRELTAEVDLARADLQAILDNVPARITLWDAASKNCFANRAAEAQYGLTAGEIVGRPMQEIIGAQLYRGAKAFVEAALAGEPVSHEQIEPQRDGSQRYSRVDYIPKRQDGAVVGLYVFATDVSDVRNSYERIRELAQRLETVREDERHSVAQALHEGIAQDLFVMKLGVANLQTRAADRAGVTRACQELVMAIDKCMSATRQVANKLQPSALAHLPLAAALREHCRYFGEISGLRIGIVEKPPGCTLDEATSLILFRAAQEALTNVARHARASRVDIELRAAAHHVTVDITDDGIGIEHAALAKPGSLGLLAVRERVGAVGGRLVITNNAGAGATVSIHLPVGVPTGAVLGRHEESAGAQGKDVKR
ncbi:MAG: GAF domain-containing protein [Steroidobacteraceae bacterium]|jgi:PAS domain S-box-containing protein